MTMNQWLDSQESWLEALPGGREGWQLGENSFKCMHEVLAQRTPQDGFHPLCELLSEAACG